MSAFVVFLVGIFPHYGSIWRFAILCFQSESVKIRTRKTRNMDIFYTVYLLQKKDEFCSCKLKTINFVAKTLNQLWWSNQKFNKSGVLWPTLKLIICQHDTIWIWKMMRNYLVILALDYQNKVNSTLADKYLLVCTPTQKYLLVCAKRFKNIF